MIYTHRVYSLVGDETESRIDLSKVVAITRNEREVVVHFGGRHSLSLQNAPDCKVGIGTGTTPETYKAAVERAYANLVAAWERQHEQR